MKSSPAKIVSTWLRLMSLGSNPDNNTDWPVTYGSQPTDPDNIITVYNTVGRQDGRLMATGEVIQHPGIQIRIRATDEDTGWGKAKELCDALDALTRVDVATDEGVATIQNASRVGDIIPLGNDRETQRQLFTINLVVTIKY